MRFLSFRQATLTLLASTALIVPAALAANYTVSTPTTVQNGAPGNVLNGDDSLSVLSGGGISTSSSDAVNATGANNNLDNAGTLATTGNFNYGIYALDGNTITNSGTISTTGDNTVGIYADDNNTVTNSGPISTTGTDADGIVVRDNNTVTNSGPISTTGASSDGIVVRDNNTVTNSGPISTTGASSDGIWSMGINNNINNAGTITIGGSSSIGIRLLNNSSASNSGTVIVGNNNSAGIEIIDNNIVANTGTITTQADNTAGIRALYNNTISNTGTITTQGNTTAGIIAYNNNTISNAGTITTQGDYTAGIRTAGSDNIINNSGNINTSGTNGAGISIDSSGNIINNSGTILETGSGTTAAIWGTPASNGTTINNSGKIVSSHGDAFNFSSGGGGNMFNLSAPSFIGGSMFFGSADMVKITTGRSHSVLWDFSNGSSPTPTMAFTGPVPWAWDAATSKFATIDPTALSAAPDMLADTTRLLSGVTRANSATNDKNWWLNGYGNFSGYGAQGVFNDYNTINGGIAAGASFILNDNFSLGAMAGYMASNLTVNSKWMTSQTIRGNGIVGGVYGSARVDNMFVDFAVYAGGQNNSSARLVNDNLAPLGVDYANASYNSWFVSPEVRVGLDIPTNGNWTLTPSASTHFSSERIAGYSETGSNANATIAQRQVQVFEGNLELAATRKLKNGSFTLKGGAQYRQQFGGASQNVSLLGQTLAIPLNTAATIIGYAGVDANFNISDTGTLSLGLRGAIGQNNFKSVSAVAGFNNKLL